MTRVSVEEIHQDVSALSAAGGRGRDVDPCADWKPIAEIKPVVGPPQGCARLDYARESARCLRTLDVLLPEDVIDTFEST